MIAGLHLALAGGNAYWLCRECGIGRVAALCGGLTFMLGGATAALASWLPTTILGPYVWLPAAAAMTERILRRPNLRNALGLGACLTMSLLPGFPQVTLFTVQFIALRVLWELATYPVSRRVGVLGWVALGGTLPALFGAAFLLPALEFSARSVRSGNLSPSEAALHGVVDWRGFAAGGGDLVNGFLPIFTLVPTVLAAFAFTRRGNWRLATFHVLVALLYLGLACSAALFALYAALPLGSLFRNPDRFLWMTSFAIVVPVALGADALLRPRSVHHVRALGTALAGLALGVLVFAVVCRRPYVAMERWWLVALAGVAVAGAVRPIRESGALALALPALLLANLFTFETRPFMRRLSDPGVVFRHQEAFAFVRSRITPFDRIHVLGVHDLAFMDKSASVSGLPAVTDYEPQTSRRFAEYSFWMFEARPMRSLNDFYYQLGRVPRMRPLFDLAAARWIVADPGAVPRNSFLATLPVRWRGDGVVVLENTDALPRAFWVPRLEVVAGPEAVLSRLATGPPRDRALIELLPADGFLGGADASATGQVDDFDDASERLVVRMHATGEGFLVVSDQEYPGWSATVNGVAAPVLRANYCLPRRARAGRRRARRVSLPAAQRARRDMAVAPIDRGRGRDPAREATAPPVSARAESLLEGLFGRDVAWRDSAPLPEHDVGEARRQIGVGGGGLLRLQQTRQECRLVAGDGLDVDEQEQRAGARPEPLVHDVEAGARQRQDVARPRGVEGAQRQLRIGRHDLVGVPEAGRNGGEQRVHLAQACGRVAQARLADEGGEREQSAGAQRALHLREDVLQIDQTMQRAARPDAVVRPLWQRHEVEVALDQPDPIGERSEAAAHPGEDIRAQVVARRGARCRRLRARRSRTASSSPPSAAARRNGPRAARSAIQLRAGSPVCA